MLELLKGKFYRVKEGDTVYSVSQIFSVPVSRLCSENSLEKDIERGEIILIPQGNYTLYTLSGGEKKTDFFTDTEEYERVNGTSHFFIGMTIWI